MGNYEGNLSEVSGFRGLILEESWGEILTDVLRKPNFQRNLE